MLTLFRRSERYLMRVDSKLYHVGDRLCTKFDLSADRIKVNHDRSADRAEALLDQMIELLSTLRG